MAYHMYLNSLFSSAIFFLVFLKIDIIGVLDFFHETHYGDGYSYIQWESYE